MPISDFTRRQNAERIANSQFKVGTIVAVVNHHWDRRIESKRRVGKVHANGNFILASRNEGAPAETRQWRPDSDGNCARLAGKSSGLRHSEHLEIWTPAIEQEIVERRAAVDRCRRVAAVAERLQEQRAHTDEHTLRALEAALGLSTAAPNQPEAD